MHPPLTRGDHRGFGAWDLDFSGVWCLELGASGEDLPLNSVMNLFRSID